MGTRSLAPLAPLALFVAAVIGCGNVPDDPGARLFPAAGVIEGTVLYQGPHPCSFGGHIVGNAILLVFDRRSLPPPNGLAVISANFADVTGDVLFANEPRYSGTDAPYCPNQHGYTDTITVSSPFAVSPMAAGSFEIQGFFDYTGDFLPTFKYRELPEQGDVGGGDIDTADALKAINNGNPDYSPIFLPVEIGTPESISEADPDGSAPPPGYIPPYDMPSSGYVANNVTVSLGQVLTNTRPYFYPFGLPPVTLSSDGNTLTDTPAIQESDQPDMNTTGIAQSEDNMGATDPADYLPILTIPQDILTLSAPNAMGTANALAANANVNQFEAPLPHLNLKFGVAPGEEPCAAPPVGTTGNPCSQTQVAGQTDPFHFQLSSNPNAQGTFSVWQNAYFDAASQTWNPLQIAEGNNAPMLWPEVILSKLIDSNPDSNPPHIEDPASLTSQGAAGQPVVIIQGITFLNPSQPAPDGIGNAGQPDTLYNTVLGEGGNQLLASAMSLPFNPFDPACSAATPPTSCYNGSLFNYQTGQPTVFQQDHLTVGIRPAAICFAHLFDATPAVDTRGTLVSPYSSGPQASFPNPPGDGTTGPIVPTDILSNGDLTHRYQITNLVKNVQFGCLPRGRYAINVVYPDGQAWTVPNETGACSGDEGSTNYTPGNLTCTLKPRPILYSQGNRAVVEIVGPSNPANCLTPGQPASTTITTTTAPATSPAPAVPVDCLPRCETLACPGNGVCTSVTDPNTGGAAMVCVPPCPPNQPNCPPLTP